MVANHRNDHKRTCVHVLMYHSISSAQGPTCIPPETFAAQMATLETCGYRVATLAELSQARAGGMQLPARCAVITFDDAFADFADAAAPVLSTQKFSATVFVPTAFVGQSASWAGAGTQQSPLLSWGDMRDLLGAGFEFGSHSRRHLDLTTLSPADLHAELSESQYQLVSELGVPARFFAAPYGRTNPAVRREIAKLYELAVGVRLARATIQSDKFDIPRVEMHYFRDVRVWRAFLEGRADSYFSVRKVGRAIRSGAALLRH